MTAHDEIEQLRALMQRHCVRYGDFTLASGRTSKYYYNGKRITLRPSAMKLIGAALVDVVLASGADAVGGPELGAVPIAAAVGLAALARGRDLPVFVVRKEQKRHGARDLVVEPYADESGGDAPLVTEGRRLAIVEDAVTAGGSVQKAIDAVEANFRKTREEDNIRSEDRLIFGSSDMGVALIRLLGVESTLDAGGCGNPE